jgi:hypothetical protein
VIGSIQFFDVVLFVHVAAAVVAFGATFAYPFFQAVVERTSPRSVPAMWRAMHTSDTYLVIPGAIVLLAAGIYMTIDRFDFGFLFITAGLAGWVALLLLGALYFGPSEKRLAELAERDIAAAGDGEVELSAEYRELSKGYERIGALAGLLIVIVVFFMTVKP